MEQYEVLIKENRKPSMPMHFADVVIAIALRRFDEESTFAPARAATSTYSLAHPYRTGAAPPPRAAGRGYCAPTEDGLAGSVISIPGRTGRF